MKCAKTCCLFFSLLIVFTSAAYAQWTVFDPTNYVTALHEFQEAQQIYTTAIQTRNQVIAAYNLAYQMARMPQDLAQRYRSDFSQWTNLSSANAYGNTAGWVDALNLGSTGRAASGYASAVTQLQNYPGGSLSARDAGTQAVLKNQYATAEINQAAITSALSTIGTIRSHAEAFSQKLTQLESDTYSTDPTQQTEMAVLAKINTSTVLQIHSQQDTNQLLAAVASQQAATQKQQIDAQNRALNQAIYFEQNFTNNMQRVTGGASDTLRAINLSTSR